VDLALWTMDENTASRSADTTVVIAAGKGVEVSCQPGDRNTIQYARSCETTGWVFGSENGSTLHRAEAHVWIRPTDASLDSWSVTVLSRGVTNAPQHVTIERVSNDTPPLSPIEGTYSGTITLVDVYRFSDTAGTTAPITLDVQARVLPDLGNDISEAFEIVDPIGVFVRGNVARLLPADDAQSSLFAYMDEASSETAYYSRSHNAATGTLTGSVRMFAEVDESGDNVASLTWKFDLRRTGPLVACTRDADCVSAQRCDRERHTCLASASEIPASVNGFTISEEWLRALRSAQNRSVSAVGVAGALYLPPLYDEPTGVGRATGSESIDIFGAEAFDRVSGPREGWIACDESIARWGEGVAEALGTQARSEFCVNPTCSQRRDPATACSSMYYEQGALNEDLASTSIPCFLATPAATPAPNGRLAAVRAVAGWEATCEGLYANLARSSRDVPATFSGFLSESCVRPAGQHAFVIRDENGEDRHHVYLCRRYKEALLGPFSSRRTAERSLCYEPGTGARPLLASTHFDDGRGNVSHEELCQSGLPPRGIDLIHYQDRTDLLGVDQLDSSELLSSCAHELDARPPAIGGNLGLAWNALLNGGVCFSAAQFYAAMSALRSSFDRDFSLSSSLLHRLLRQWLELHSFVAHETLEQRVLAGVLRYEQTSAGNSSSPDIPELERTLDQMRDGWDFLFEHGRVILHMSNQDYEHDWSESGPKSLPVTIIDTASRHLRLAKEFADDEYLRGAVTCAPGAFTLPAAVQRQTSTALRYTIAAEALARRLYDDTTAIACTSCPQGTACGVDNVCVRSDGAVARQVVEWSSEWESSLIQLAAARAGLRDSITRILRCETPLGLSDTDVPLFFGDPTGDTNRFFAASDYLVTGWAVPAVNTALASLDQARAAWLQRRESDIQQQLTDQEAERRREDLAARYGRPLVDACGLKDVEAKDALALFQSGALRVDDCFVDKSRPECTADARDLWGNLQSDDPRVRFELCYWNQVFGAGYSREHQMAAGWSTATVDLDLGSDEPSPTVQSAGYSLPLDSFFFMAAWLRTNEEGDNESRALAVCAEHFGGVEHRLPSPQDDDPLIAERAACYRGQLGDALVAGAAAEKATGIAISEWKDTQDAYQLGARHCIERIRDADQRLAVESAHSVHMGELQWLLKVAQKNTGGLNLLSSLTSFRIGDVVDLLAGNSNMSDKWSPSAVQRALEEADRKHRLVQLALERNTQALLCFQEVDLRRVGIRTAALRVGSADVEAKTAWKRLVDVSRSLEQVLLEGPAAVAREEHRTVPQIAFHYWLDERVARFQKDFEWSKRLTFLALRAVEYEMQQSIGLGEIVLSASHPEQLRDALQTIQQEQVARTINSRRPESSIVVLSLRDEIFRMEDRSRLEPGERAWTPQQRFQHRLVSDTWAVYDATGTEYLGQGVPFIIEPRGALEHRCAERMWEVTATLQGDLLDTREPFAHVFVIKRNNFASQWCTGLAGEEAYQVGSMPPVSRLFHPSRQGGAESAGIERTTALIQPWLNVPRSEFYKQQYIEGASDEFAGRGMYGEYVLLFPWKGLLENGFPLEQVEDVLLRIDYLSVDDLQLPSANAVGSESASLGSHLPSR
jgi:hypothetical protein